MNIELISDGYNADGRRKLVELPRDLYNQRVNNDDMIELLILGAELSPASLNGNTIKSVVDFYVKFSS